MLEEGGLGWQNEMKCYPCVLVMLSKLFPFPTRSGKLQDLYSKGHPYPGYPGYIMMSNMNDSYMNNGSLSPPMPRTVSTNQRLLFHSQRCLHNRNMDMFASGQVTIDTVYFSVF